jgi:outer membrane immunogenic protein
MLLRWLTFLLAGFGPLPRYCVHPKLFSPWGRIDRTLVDVKVGGGWVRSEASVTQLTTGSTLTASHTNGGWLVGAGFEYAFAHHWTAKFEHDFLSLADKNFPGFAGTRAFELEREVQQVKVGINFKF